MRPSLILLSLCVAEAFSMAGFSTVPALLPTLQTTWQLSAGEAGALGGSYFAGYILAISWLSSLTDRIDARRVFMLGALISSAGSFGFSILAQGLWSACLFQAVIGAGLAGTYMPGLRALMDRVGPALQPRFIAFYTSTFGIGASLSYAIAGWVANQWGWPTAFWIAGLQQLLAGALVWKLLDEKHPPAQPPRSLLRSQWHALKDRKTRNFILGYAAHCWELFGFRAWIVALLAYSETQGSLPLSAPTLAALVNLVGIPASILGNEVATRGNRQRYIVRIMLLSGTLAWVTGIAAPYPWLLILILPFYFVAVMADSAALTAGLVASTTAYERGAAMAVYSLGGFGAGLIAPLCIGFVLDLCGGQNHTLAWLLACGCLGVWGLFHAFNTWRQRESAQE